jgi:hypothetical protein
MGWLQLLKGLASADPASVEAYLDSEKDYLMDTDFGDAETIFVGKQGQKFTIEDVKSWTALEASNHFSFAFQVRLQYPHSFFKISFLLSNVSNKCPMS